MYKILAKLMLILHIITDWGVLKMDNKSWESKKSVKKLCLVNRMHSDLLSDYNESLYQPPLLFFMKCELLYQHLKDMGEWGWSDNYIMWCEGVGLKWYL